MVYYYTYTSSPDLTALELEIKNSELSTIYDYLRWDEDDDKLKIVVTRIVSTEEKQLLDNIFLDI